MQGPGDPTTKDGKFQDSYTRNNSLDVEANLQLIQEYFKTHDPALLDELKAQLKKTPQRAKTDADQDASLKNNKIATFITDATGRDGKADIKGLPGAVASHLVPAGPLGKLGKGSRAGKNAARGLRAAGSIGSNVAQTLIENPDADFDDHKQAAVEDFIASTGMRAAGGAGRAIVGGAAHALSRPGAASDTPGGTPPADASIPETATPSTGIAQPGQVAPSASPGGQPGPGQPAPAPPSPSGGSLPNNGGPPQASPSAQQPAFPPLRSTPEDQAHERIQKLQSKEREEGLSPEEKRELDEHQKTVAASEKQRLDAGRAGTPPAVHPLPGKTERDQADEGLKRLQAKKEKEGTLSLEEQIELDRHEKTRAATQKHHLETEQQVLRAGNPPRELDPHRARILAEADRKLAMPVPGTPPATDPAQPPQAAAGTDPGAGQPPPPQPSAESGIPVTATKPGDPQTAPTRPATPSPQAPAPAPAKPFRPQLDATGSSKRIHNILNQPPGQRGHANTQADLAVAAKVAADRVKELQNQPGPLSEEQKQELAACQAALARLQQETTPPPQAADGLPPPPGDNTPPGGTSQAPPAVDTAAAQTQAEADKRLAIPEPGTPPTTGNTQPPVVATATEPSAGTQPAPSVPSPPSDGPTPGKRALFDDVPWNEKTEEMRKADNDYLRAHAIPRRQAPSQSAIINKQAGVAGLAMEKAALLMDSVHDGVGLGRVQVGFEAPASGRAAGEYLPASGFRDARIMVSDLTRTPVMTGLHEYGHHVEKQLAPADVAAVVEAARKTISASELATDLNNAEYYLAPHELFARAYAQFITQSSGDAEALGELKAVRKGWDRSRYWDRNDFQPVADAITMALKRKGWQP